MGVVLVCAGMLIGGLVLSIRWSAIPLATPPGEPDGTARVVALRLLWWIALATAAGAASGVLVMGAGGRLAMRLLAVTADDDAQGRITEADEIVGEITVGGTIGFMVFIGLFGGLLTGLLYVAVQRWLPRGRGRGLWFGALLLVILATRIEPLRTNNEDFDLVGPAWVSIPVFGALALAHGAAVAAFCARWSRTQPLLTTRRAVLRYLPMLPFLLLVPYTVGLLVLALLALAFQRFGARQWWHRRGVDVAGRVALIAITVIAIPGFVAAIVDIADRSP
jgi:hypothetical protein